MIIKLNWNIHIDDLLKPDIMNVEEPVEVIVIRSCVLFFGT